MIGLVDCNNFFASCERLFRPDLAQVPVAVLSSNDGCVVARSNEVRQLGVEMGTPLFQIKELFRRHKVQYFSSNFALYSDLSQRVQSFLAQWVPNLEVYSIDEAFFGLAQLKIVDYKSWGNQLQNDITRYVGIPVSVGIAPTKTLAKLASSYAKTQGSSCVLEPQAHPVLYKKVLQAMAVGEVWGVGRKWERRFNQAGVKTAWQLASTSQDWLADRLGITGRRLYEELHGTVAYPLEYAKKPRQSLLVSRSFGQIIYNHHELETALASFSSQAAFRLRQHHQRAGVFGIYLRFRNTEGAITSQTAFSKLLVPSQDTSELVECGLTLLNSLYTPDYGYKKAGVFAYQLQPADHYQLALTSGLSTRQSERRETLLHTIDVINTRFGGDTIHVASVNPKARQWHGKKAYQSPCYTTSWLQLPRVYPAQ